ncbi:MAG: hypothetical protein ACREGB_04115 [Candidatus Saccharimonadales bacterium]
MDSKSFEEMVQNVFTVAKHNDQSILLVYSTSENREGEIKGLVSADAEMLTNFVSSALNMLAIKLQSALKLTPTAALELAVAAVEDVCQRTASEMKVPS